MPRKIFELAKEFEMGALDLVEKLKGEGFAVRNHMSSVADDDMERVLELLKPKKDDTKKKTKKKVVRKKKAKAAKKTKKKTETKSVRTVTSGKGKKEELEATAKKTTKKKRSVIIRRKKSVEEEELAAKEREEALSNTEEETQVEQELQVERTSGDIVHEEDDDGKGLRVVSKPESAKNIEEGTEETVEEASSEKKEVVFKERVHRFTPVYIPPKEVKEEKTEKSEVTEGEDKDKENKDDKEASRKRMKGLASLMSGKTKTVNRSQQIIKERSEHELKSYSALSGLGRPIYSQIRRKKQYIGEKSKTQLTEIKESKRVVVIHDSVVASELSNKLSVKFEELADMALEINLLIKDNDYLGLTLTAELSALFGYRVENRAFSESEVIEAAELTDVEKEKLPSRDPIITIMGHVDHGKTTLLDFIREAKVVQGEAGGITQHIGAYKVKVKDSNLTFLDTPGHAAFASMRQRGANVTDLVVLVVAADDGVMPQTKESIKFCKEAGVPIIIAVNKMDREGVNPDRIKQELAEFDLSPEEWGGQTQYCHISALKGDGIDGLLEAIALQTEMLELRADPKGQAEGVVVESEIEQGRGPVATVLIQKGTLKKGDNVVVGECYGRARNVTDHMGVLLKTAGPSSPVQILGLDKAPAPGDILNVVKNEREAKKVVANRVDKRKELELQASKKTISLEDFFATVQDDSTEQKVLKLIVRADVQGSYEAIVQSVEALTNNEVKVQVISGGVGAISDNDVNLASSALGFIIGFNMRPVTSARRLAEQKGVDIKNYSIIYELISDVKLAIEGLLDPEFVETYIGRAEVKDTFMVPKVGMIAGSLVIDGKIQKGCKIRLLREGKIVFDGKMSSLKRFKDDVREVKNGYECGIGLENYNDIKLHDLFEAYMNEEKKRTLEDVEQG